MKDVPYEGSRAVDWVGAGLSVVGMGGVVLGILVWQEGGEYVGLLIGLGVVALGGFVWWLRDRKRRGRATLVDPELFRSKLFRTGVSGQLLQQVALGGTMIVLPIYLQMVLGYNALLAGISIAPLSLSMFAVALLAGRRGQGPAELASSWSGFVAAGRRGSSCSSSSCRVPSRAGGSRSRWSSPAAGWACWSRS